MTEKGLSTAKAQLFDKRAKIIRSVNNKARMLQTLMNNPVDFTQFESEYQNFVDIISNLMDAHNRYHSLLESEMEITQDDDTFAKKDKEICNLKTTFIQYMREQSKTAKSRSSSHKSSKSGNSVKSKMSIASRLSAAEQAAQRKAKLAALAQERIF